jgi:tetrahydromethanopterin S-methyltransferase subunit G
MASKLKTAAGSFERLMLPRLNSIDGELKAMNTRIDAVNGRIDAVNGRIDDSVRGLAARIDESDKRAESFRSEFRAELNAVQTKLEAIDQKLDVDRRMTTLEAKLKDLEKRN